MRIVKKKLNFEDLKLLALLSSNCNTFINRVNKSKFPVGVIKKAGDLESFYYNITGIHVYEGEEYEEKSE